MRTRLLAIALAMLVAGASAQVFACGFCIEDRVAAVYDQKVVDDAVARRHEVAFFAIEGPLGANAAFRRAVLAALEGGGAIRGTARVAVENAACSVAFDPAKADPARLAAAAERRLSARGLTLTPLRVLDSRGRLREP
jgi:hypothetical protein